MKYIIDIPDEAIEFMGGHIRVFVEPEFKMGDCKFYALRLSKEDIEPYTELDRKQIEDEAWKLARLISLEADDGGLSPTDLYECYKSSSIQEVMKNYSYQEAKAKYEVWMKAKRDKESRIEVGDEVSSYDDIKAVVMDFQTNDGMIVFTENGCIERWAKTHRAEKTGRTFPAVEKMLKQMRGEK